MSKIADSRVHIIGVGIFVVVLIVSLYFISRKFNSHLEKKFGYSLLKKESFIYSVIGTIFALLTFILYSNKQPFAIVYICAIIGICVLFLQTKMNVQKTDYADGISASFLQILVSIGLVGYYTATLTFYAIVSVIAFIFKVQNNPKWKKREEERERNRIIQETAWRARQQHEEWQKEWQRKNRY